MPTAASLIKWQYLVKLASTMIEVLSYPCQTFFSSIHKFMNAIFGKVGKLASEGVTLQLCSNE